MQSRQTTKEHEPDEFGLDLGPRAVGALALVHQWQCGWSLRFENYDLEGATPGRIGADNLSLIVLGQAAEGGKGHW
jgi:hypothetical protein